MRPSFFRFRLASLLTLLLAYAGVLNASDYASVLSDADWHWQTRGDVTYGWASFTDLYGSPQRVSIAKYSSTMLGTSLFVKERSPQGTHSLAIEAGATAAINGSYFNMTTLTSTTALWVDGKEIQKTSAEEYARCNGAIGFKDGDFDLLHYSSATTSSQLAAWGRKYDSFVVSGPIIRRNNVSQDTYIGGEGFYGPHPRTMLGKCADGTVYMVVCEGRMDDAAGFSLQNLLLLAEDFGMTDAINLDGGGSSTLWVAGDGIVNRLVGGAYRNMPNIIIATSKTHQHTYENGFCICETAPYEPASVDDEGYYEIDNAGKLFWLAKLVNNGFAVANARLTADIDLENRPWTPMGNSANRHQGEFDGQGYSISGLNIQSDASTLCSAFIGYHTGTKDIHNFRIAGSVTASGTSVDHFAAGVIGFSSGNHKIQDIWCSVNITNANAEKVSLRMAGIVVEAEACTINRCVYDGTIVGKATNLQVAGILGWANANGTSVTNCLFAGALSSTGTASNSAYQGGIVGFSSSARSDLTYQNNLSIGTLSSPSAATRTGALVGNSTSAATSFSNNYVLQGLRVAGTGTASSKVPTVTEVTTAQLTDGTLPQKLSAANWTQGTSSPIPQDMEGALTDDDLIVGGIKYEITGHNTASVTFPNQDQPSSANPCPYSGKVTIPQSVTIRGNEYNVTAIGDYAFHYANVTELNLPEGITKLGYKAIYQTKLTEITVPNSVTTMDYEALAYNKQLEKIVFGENIAANTWGDKLCIYGGKKYEVFMNCDAVPKLRSYTFDFTGANVHVRPSMYQAFIEDAAWSKYDIIGDLWKEYTYDDLLEVISTYTPKVPSIDEIGTDPGCYSLSSAMAMSEAISDAMELDEDATLEELNNAINGILSANDALYVYPLHEGYYYIENVCFPGYALDVDKDKATSEGLKAVALDEVDTPPYFKLTRRNGHWLMQSVNAEMYIGTVIGLNANGKPVSLTDDARHEQIITWVGGGRFKIQGTSTYPYAYTGSRVRVYNYSAGGSFEPRQMWRIHPAASGTFSMEYNLENERVRGFVHDFEYTKNDPSRVSTYNVGPPVRRDWPLPVCVFWTQDIDAEWQTVTWSESPDFANAVSETVPAEAASHEIYNLIPGRTYYCKVDAIVDEGYETTELARFAFTTSGQMRHIKAEGTANVRDLGGWTTQSGMVVKYGKLFRGGEWNGGHNLEPEAIEALRLAGIKAELDLRSDSEAKNITRSVLGSDITYKRTPLGQTASHMNGLNGSKETYKAALNFVLTSIRNDKPVYFHCAIGRDRTGTLAFLLEGALGMSKSDIYKDYELTNFSYWGTPCIKTQLDEMFDTIEGQTGETLEQKFRTYLKSYFGISDSAIDRFREKMLEAPSTPDGIAEIAENPLPFLSGNENGKCYDLSGRLLSNSKFNIQSSKLRHGVYIINGRKVVK